MSNENEVVKNRHDILLLFEVVNGNPNGDPDAGNMPRIEPNSNRGIISDVCLKRKVRNYVEAFERTRNGGGYEIFIKSGPALERIISEAAQNNNNDPKATVEWLCRQFYDIRAFGGVLSVGSESMKGSAFGQLRGPVQFTFAQSYDEITPLDITITRCVVTAVKDEKSERTMGSKFIVPYALYSAKVYVSPAFAERTGFTNRDLNVLFDALNHLFEHDRSAARGEMIVRGIYDFEHVGKESPENSGQREREAKLGCAPAHKLFEGIDVRLADGKEFPQSFEDYIVNCRWDNEPLPQGVVLHKRHLEQSAL
jgi:CRISPR-associated protein Csd2